MARMFEPWSIGPMEVGNRIVKAATAESLCTKEGVASKRLVDLYRGLAKGGAGLIVTGFAYVAPDGKAQDRSMSMCDEAALPELKALVDAVHDPQPDDPDVAGSRIVAQLVYGGSKSRLAADDPRRSKDPASAQGEGSTRPNADILGPSCIEHPLSGLVPRAATKGELARVANAFAQAASRAKRAGFDGVEVHAAHGYLLSQFLDGRFNKRTDEYGSTLEGRARLAVECVASIRRSVGEGYPVLVKLNSSDRAEDAAGEAGGLSEDESLRVASWLVEAGASCIEVSGDWHAFDAEDVTGEPFFGSFGARMAQHVDVPVIVTGGWRDPEVVERYFATTGIAAIGMARPLISQPYLPQLWQSGVLRAAECISCNFCAKHNGIPCILRKGR